MKLNLYCPKCKTQLNFNGHRYKDVQAECEQCGVWWLISAYLLKNANDEVIECEGKIPQ